MVCAWFRWCADVSATAMRWWERGGVAVLICSGRSCGAHDSARVVAGLRWWRHCCSAMEMRTAACSRENGRHHWCMLDVLVATVTESTALLQAR